MRNGHVCVTLVMGWFCIVPSGCAQYAIPLFGDMQKVSDAGLKALDKHDDAMAKQHADMSPEVAEKIRASRAQSAAEIARLREDVKIMEPLLASVNEETVRLVAGLAGVPDSVTNAVLNAGNKMRKEVDEKIEKSSVQITADIRSIETLLAKLSSETTAKLGSLTEDNIAKLATLTNNDEAFRRELQAAAKLTNAEMAGLKGMSAEEIMLMLGAAGAATAAGGALGKTGKSRSHDDIEKLKDLIAKLPK